MYLGLLDRLGLSAGTALAFLELRWKFRAPVLVGDTVHARVVNQAKSEGSTSRSSRVGRDDPESPVGVSSGPPS